MVIIRVSRYILVTDIPMTLHSREVRNIPGKTGKPLVHGYPQGEADRSNNQTETIHDLDALIAEQLTLLEAPTDNTETIISQLVEQGQVTQAQVQVGRHDQVSTGLNLLEALTARGWLSPEQVEAFGDQFI